MLRYLLTPEPRPTPKPKPNARPTPTATRPTVLRRLGSGRASGLAPRSMIIVFAPSQCAIVFGNAEAGSSATRRDNDEGEEFPGTGKAAYPQSNI